MNENLVRGFIRVHLLKIDEGGTKEYFDVDENKDAYINVNQITSFIEIDRNKSAIFFNNGSSNVYLETNHSIENIRFLINEAMAGWV